ncbi:MAG: glycosyltransferase family 4 protein [Candidatus Margulisiibacteriota bacterium]
MNTSVLVVSQLFYPELMSTGQTLTELCEALAAEGIDVEVWAGQPSLQSPKITCPKYMSHQGIAIRRLPTTQFPKRYFWGKFINHLGFYVSLAMALILDRPKKPILVLTNPPLAAVVCALLNRLLGLKFVLLLFDLYPDTAENVGVLNKTSLLSRIWRACNRLVFSRAERVIVIGRCMQNKVMSAYHLPAQKLAMIPLWADTQLLNPKQHVQKPIITVGYTGNMGRFHDMDTIMKAALELKANPGIQFLFVGDGYRLPEMKAFAKKNSLDNCVFQDHVPRAALPQLLHQLDMGLVSLMPGQEGCSVPSKTFGLLASGLPVVAVIPAASEIALILNENECGMIVEPGDVSGLSQAILRLASDVELRQKMGDKGHRCVVDSFRVSAAAKAYHQLLKEVQ